MSNVRTFARSFVGGEVTPEFFGQIADAKFQTGLALARNFRILPHGPAENRPGTAFVRAVKTPAKKTKLLPFTYSTTQTFAIEAGEQYFRFHTLGATLQAGTATAYNGATAYVVGDLASSGGINYYAIQSTTGNAPPNATYWYPLPSSNYEIPSVYNEADLFDLHYVQSQDVFTIVHPNYAPRELRRLGATKWVLSVIPFVSQQVAPTNVRAAATVATGTGFIGHKYLVTSVDSTGLEESLSSDPALQTPSLAITGITQANPGVITTATHNLAVDDKVYVTQPSGMVQLTTGYYLVNTIPSSTTFSLKTLAGVPIDTTAYSAWTSGGTVQYEGVKNNLLTSGNYNTITWTASATAVRYNVYKQSNGLYGYLGQTDQTTFKDDNITPDISQTPPIANNPFNGANNYPGAVSYFEQRRDFAGTINKPQTLWMTRSGTESNLASSIPTRDDDAITVRVAAREANTIRHIVPLQSLILLTSAAEWQVTSVNSDAITPTSISVKPQSYIGASNVQPVIVNNNVIYAAARGGHLRELAYNWQASGFVSGDLSLRAPHLFDGYDILDLAYAKSPQPIVWATSTSGDMLGLTYLPEQQIGAMHHHDSYTLAGKSLFESVCVVAEGAEDAVYVVVNRTVNGSQTRYIERFASRRFATQADQFFVDCGATYNGAPATTISGLTWLEGETVSVLADGAVQTRKTVVGGSITLDDPASKVQVGLPITADIQTLPLALEITGFGQGRVKNINKVWLRVFNSTGIFAGPSFDNLTEAKQRTTEPYGSPPALKTGEIPIMVTPAYQDGGQLCVRQSDPVALTLVSMSMEVAVGG